MVRTMLSNGMSVSQDAKCLSRSEGKIMKRIFSRLYDDFFLATLSGKRRFENYSVNI